MKLTTSKLKQLIKEEMQNIFSEGPSEKEIDRAKSRDTDGPKEFRDIACKSCDQSRLFDELRAAFKREFGKSGKAYFDGLVREQGNKGLYTVYGTWGKTDEFPDGVFETWAVVKYEGFVCTRLLTKNNGTCVDRGYGYDLWDIRQVADSKSLVDIESGSAAFKEYLKKHDPRQHYEPKRCGFISYATHYREAPKRRRRRRKR